MQPPGGTSLQAITAIREFPVIRDTVPVIGDAGTVCDIVTHPGKPTLPPRLMNARSRPLWEMQGPTLGEDEPQLQPVPEYEFDIDAAC